MALHNAQELHNNFGGRANENLALAPALSVDNVVLPGIESRVHCALSEGNTHKAVVLDRMINKGTLIHNI